MQIIKIDIARNERAVLLVDGTPRQWLGAGRTWKIAWSGKLEVVRARIDQAVCAFDAELAELAPKGALIEVRNGEHERAVVWRDGRAAAWLGVGVHRVWNLGAEVRVEAIDTRQPLARVLSRELCRVVPAAEYSEVTVPEGQVGLRMVDGQLDAVLQPGRYGAWTTAERVQVQVVDLREQLLSVAGQDVMTRDRVSLRLNTTATWRVAEPAKAARATQDPAGVVYLAVQVAIRAAVTTRTLDELLAQREVIAGEIAAQVVDEAARVGVAVWGVALKDIVLPGDMKVLLNRVIEARKQAEANVILRREEAAATRAQAQTAQLLTEQPALMRLKELEALREIAGEIGDVHLVLGDGGLEKLALLPGQR